MPSSIDEAVVQVSEAARQAIRDYLAGGEGGPAEGLRIAIASRGPAGFRYSFHFVTAGERVETDWSMDLGGAHLFIPAADLEDLRGASIEYDIDPWGGGGLRIDNPNSVWADDTSRGIQEALDQEINPAIAAHGGFVQLVEFKEGVVVLQFGGGCQGCGMIDVTLREGIEQRLKELFPEIVEVRDVTDHAAGVNPYYA